MKGARTWAGAWGARVLGALLARLPLPVAQKLGRAAARGYLAAGGRRVRWSLRNLEIAFPSWSDSARRSLALQSTENLALNFIDLFRSQHWTESELLSHVAIEGLEHLSAALEPGRGAVVLSLHMGCYDVGLRALSVRAPWLEVAAVAMPLRSALAQGWIRERRNVGAVELVETGPGSALRVLRLLRAGRPVIVLGDLFMRDVRRALVPFFGRRCHTPAGPAALSRRTSAPLVPCYVIRDGPDHHVVRFLPALEVPPGLRPDDEEGLTRLCNAALEEIIRKHPEHWVWGHRRFRHSPDVPPGIYRPRLSARSARSRRSS